jgi:glutaredoxin
MKLLLKIGAVLLVSTLLISSIYVVSFMESEKPESNNGGNNGGTNENSENNSNNTNGNENEDKTEIIHTVFVEEGTATWCNNCPVAEDILHKTYNSDNPDFYYVSMIDEKNTKAHNRLYNDYNILGFPTVFIDGGYGVIMGSGNFESVFKDKLSDAKARKTHRLLLNLNTTWTEDKKELTTKVTVENKETTTYIGRLKVYVTEINSRWFDWTGKPYHFAFLDYAIDKNIKIIGGGNETFSEIWNASKSGYPDVYPENLWIVATVFNEKSTKEYSDPPKNEHSFNSYYVDATDAKRVTKGDIPPTAGICHPRTGRRYIFGFGNEKHKTLTGKTIIIGKIKIKTCLESESNIEKIDFIVKGRSGEVKGTVYEKPYEWTWDTLAFGKYTITVKVYNKSGRVTESSLDVIAFINLIELPSYLNS